jgi:hypothetical protein
LEHLLFAGYLLLFAWLVTRTPFFLRSGLTPAQLIIVFLLKVMAMILYGYVGVYYGTLAQMVDTWYFHYSSLEEYRLLLDDPGTFVSSLFDNPYPGGYTRFLTSRNSWWNDLPINLFNKILAVFHLFSFGNYYINGIFYSYLTLFGLIGLFRIMNHHFPHRTRTLLVALFLAPSFLYWTSGIHKDGLIFCAFLLTITPVYYALQRRQIRAGGLLRVLLGLFILLVLRNYLVVLLVPALLAWWVAGKTGRPWPAFLSMYALYALLFFTLPYLHPALNFPLAVVHKQQDFLTLFGNSSIPVTPLQPHSFSFLHNAPEAFTHAVLRPYPSDVKHLLSLLCTLELFFLGALLLLFLAFRRPHRSATPFVVFCLFFSFSLLMTIGYSVNFLGAIVRYRSLALPFLVVPMVAATDWKRAGAVLRLDINKNKYV